MKKIFNCFLSLLVSWVILSQTGHAKLRHISTHRDLQQCPSTCDAGLYSCNGFKISSCAGIQCVDACSATDFDASSVECQDSASCLSAKFRSSKVDCVGQTSCESAWFFSSEVKCMVFDYSFESSCIDTT